MPQTKNTIRRYALIERCILSELNPYPGIKSIKTAVYNFFDKGVSSSTIEKDIKTLRAEYNAPIYYCPYNNGYYYGDPDYRILKELFADLLD